MATVVGEMKVTAIAPWFGSKRTLASTIIEEFGEHRAYWEPFCGSMAVLLAKPQVTMETVVDLHGDLVNLARTVQNEETALDLYGRLSRTIMCEQLFTEAATRFRARGHMPASETPDVDRATDFMICSWFGRNGVAGTQSYNQGFCVRYTKNGGHGATRWVSAVDSIPDWHKRLRHVTVLNRDSLDVIERIEDAAGVVLYADPPYLVKAAKYVHDFASDDHKRLAELLCRFTKTRVVVSYYADPQLAALYPGWTVRRLKATKAMANQNRRGGEGETVEAPEVLLINGPSLVEPIKSGLFLS